MCDVYNPGGGASSKSKNIEIEAIKPVDAAFMMEAVSPLLYISWETKFFVKFSRVMLGAGSPSFFLASGASNSLIGFKWY